MDHLTQPLPHLLLLPLLPLLLLWLLSLLLLLKCRYHIYACHTGTVKQVTEINLPSENDELKSVHFG